MTPSWDALLTLFETFQKAEGLADRTIKNRRDLVRSIVRTTGKQPLEITRDDLLARMGRGIAVTSMQRERADMQAFFRWAKSEKYLPTDPAKKLPKVRGVHRMPRPFTLEQVDAILNSGPYRDTRTMILLGAFAGLRAFEIAKVRGEDFDLISGMLRVVGKGGKDATIPLHPVIRDVARWYPREGYWFPSSTELGHITRLTVITNLGRAIRGAGIKDPKLTGHSLRHTYGTELVKAGVDIRVVQILMRHDRLSSTEIYTKIPEVMTRDAIGKLPALVIPARSGRSAAA